MALHTQAHLRRWAIALAVVWTAGLALILVAWAAARDSVVVEDQMSWAALGLAGASVTGLAAVAGLTAARRACRMRLYAVTSALARYLPADGAEPLSPAVAAVGEEWLVTALNMRHYHRPACPLVAGKGAREVTEAERGEAGLEPCAVCEA